jgi:hypothetical protein
MTLPLPLLLLLLLTLSQLRMNVVGPPARQETDAKVYPELNSEFESVR